MDTLTADRQAPVAEPVQGLLPFISVIVPVRNEERFIRGTLRQLLAQRYDPERFEILVADGESTDRTREVVSELAASAPNLRLLPNPRRWSSAGRNAGVRAARGELLVVVDGHCELDNPDYLRDLAGAFARSGADCLGRPQPLDVSGASALQRAVAAARSCWLGHHPDSFIYSAAERFVPAHSVAVAYRREVFDRVGLFDESFDACEDVELNHRIDRAGMRCLFAPRIAVRYVPRGTLAGLFRQMARYGRGRVRLLRKHPDTFRLPSLAPGAFVAGVLFGAPLALLSPALGAAYVAALALYLSVVLATSAGLALKAREPRLLACLPAVFAAIHGGAGYGILREAADGLRHRLRSSWRARRGGFRLLPRRGASPDPVPRPLSAANSPPALP